MNIFIYICVHNNIIIMLHAHPYRTRMINVLFLVEMLVAAQHNNISTTE